MATRPIQHGLAADRELKRVAPGFYVDGFGLEYFYLTGLYARMTNRLLENPALNTPAFVTEVLYELRSALQDMDCTELMD